MKTSVISAVKRGFQFSFGLNSKRDVPIRVSLAVGLIFALSSMGAYLFLGIFSKELDRPVAYFLIAFAVWWACFAELYLVGFVRGSNKGSLGYFPLIGLLAWLFCSSKGDAFGAAIGEGLFFVLFVLFTLANTVARSRSWKK